MSADTYRKCPVCKNRPDEYKDGIEPLYGKIPIEEFIEMEDRLKYLERVETVKIYYEITMEEDKTMSIDVSAQCEVCGAVWKLKEKDIPYDLGTKH